jgi:two-component system response regulator LytT
MTTTSLYQVIQHRHRHSLAAGVVLLIAMNVLLDFLFTWFRNSAFYFSESLLFSSFWLLFIPSLNALSFLFKKADKTSKRVGLTVAALLLHFIIYPFFIAVLSALFYEHTYAWLQTFSFALPAYFIQAVIIYTGSLLLFLFFNEKKITQPAFTASLIVADNNNRKQVIPVKEILCFSASPPYVSVHHFSKKYLYTATLKSLEQKLDARYFVRIHKSHIVNISAVVSIHSRQNGDYDISLSDNTVLRVSRNYARAFRSALAMRPQLTAE